MTDGLGVTDRKYPAFEDCLVPTLGKIFDAENTVFTDDTPIIRAKLAQHVVQETSTSQLRYHKDYVFATLKTGMPHTVPALTSFLVSTSDPEGLHEVMQLVVNFWEMETQLSKLSAVIRDSRALVVKLGVSFSRYLSVALPKLFRFASAVHFDLAHSALDLLIVITHTCSQRVLARDGALVDGIARCEAAWKHGNFVDENEREGILVLLGTLKEQCASQSDAFQAKAVAVGLVPAGSES